MIQQFFVDTADTDSIRAVWEALSKNTPPSALLGITTNPNALDKIQCHTLSHFEKVVYNLTSLVSEIRGDSLGTVYVQIPNSHASNLEYIAWAKYVQSLGDGRTAVGLKIPPYDRVLSWFNTSVFHWAGNTVRKTHSVDVIDLQLNVTGVADAATFLRARAWTNIVKYVSIIPGRMSEVGIDYESHLSFLSGLAEAPRNPGTITGSMRTVEGLTTAIRYGTIPTIGMRIWDSLAPEEYLSFNSLWDGLPLASKEIDEFCCPPIILRDNIELSLSFFKQMNTLGLQMYTEFKTIL